MIDPLLLILGAAGLGLMVGSFLNVVVYRLPIMMERDWRSECHALLETPNTEDEATKPFNLARPRSRCPGCSEAIAGYDNIPVVSFLLLGGKCRHCKTKISLRYPLVELFTGFATGYVAWRFGAQHAVADIETVLKVMAASIFCWYLIALALIDFDTTYLPDSMTLPLLWGGLACGFFGWFSPDLASSVLGAMFGYLSLWAVYWAFKLATKKEGMGYGDFKLLAALGAWLGWQALPGLILISSLIGAIIGIGMMAGGRVERSQPIPFGPFLALAGLTVMFAKEYVSALFSLGGGI